MGNTNWLCGPDEFRSHAERLHRGQPGVHTDLRRGIDDLASLAQQQFHLDPFSNLLFLFCSRRRDPIKTLYMEGNGFVILYKRLEYLTLVYEQLK